MLPSASLAYAWWRRLSLGETTAARLAFPPPHLPGSNQLVLRRVTLAAFEYLLHCGNPRCRRYVNFVWHVSVSPSSRRTSAQKLLSRCLGFGPILEISDVRYIHSPIIFGINTMLFAEQVAFNEPNRPRLNIAVCPPNANGFDNMHRVALVFAMSAILHPHRNVLIQ